RPRRRNRMDAGPERPENRPGDRRGHERPQRPSRASRHLTHGRGVSPMTDLSAYGPWAVITGASSGIGRAFAERCAADGVNLVLAARSTDRLEDLGRALAHAHKIEHRVVTVDLSRADGAADLITASEDLDVGLLVSNAGSGRPGRFLDQELSD